MKTFLAALLVVSIFLPWATQAVTLGGLETTAQEAGIDSNPGAPDAIAGNLLGQVLSYVGVLFLIIMLYAGGMWMTAAGNEDRVEKAKEIILAAIIGLIIVSAAYAITRFVGESVLNGVPNP